MKKEIPGMCVKAVLAVLLLVSLGGCMSMRAMHEQMHGGHDPGNTATEKDKTENQGGHTGH